MGSRRVRQDSVTELNWTSLHLIYLAMEHCPARNPSMKLCKPLSICSINHSTFSIHCIDLFAVSAAFYLSGIVSCSVTSDSLWPCELWPTRLLFPWDSPGKNTGVGCPPSPGDLPNPGIEPVSCIAGRFFTIWATREAHLSPIIKYNLLKVLLFSSIFNIKMATQNVSSLI